MCAEAYRVLNSKRQQEDENKMNLLDSMKNKKIIVYGSKHQYCDLKFVFDELEIVDYTMDVEKLQEYISSGCFVIICGDLNSPIRLLKGMFCKDIELIRELDISVTELCANKSVYIWGTGYWCSQFENFISESVSIAGYIDSDKTKSGLVRNNKLIYSPEDVSVENAFIFVATDYIKFYEISQRIVELGYSEDQYISVHSIMERLSDRFMCVYEADEVYQSECLNKDSNIRIIMSGEVCSCCMAHDNTFGNIYLASFDSIWNSRKARIGRLSLENGTFVFCEETRCPYLSHAKKMDRKHSDIKIEFSKENRRDYPDTISPEIDCSCNLHCVSCRRELFIDKSVERKKYTEVILDRIVPVPSEIVINNVGDPFVGENSLRVIYNEKNYEKHRIGIYTNGILLIKQRVDSILEKYDTIELSVSVDAASKETYEAIRRGGNWDILMKNLEYCSELRKAGKISYFQLNYVVQATNIHEMAPFVKLADKLGVDRIAMNAIEKWAHFTDEEYEKLAVMDENGLKECFKKYFTNDLVYNELINFHNLTHTVGAKIKKMYMI